MITYKLYLIGMFFLLISLGSYAQEPSGLTLSQAWELAYKSYPGLLEKSARIDEFEYHKKEVQSHSLPQMQLQLQNSYGTFEGSRGSFFPLPGIFNVSGGSPNLLNDGSTATNSTFGSVLIDWRIFQFGKQRKAITAADLQVQEAKISFDAARLSLKSRVTRLYLDMHYTNSNLDWAEKNVKRVREIFDLSASLAEAGLKPGADTSLAASSYFQALAARDEWLGKYNASKINFSEVVPDTKFALSRQSFMRYPATAIAPDSVTLSHPYLQVLDKQVLYNQVQKELSSRKVFPSVSLLGGISARGNGVNSDGTIQHDFASGFGNPANNYLLGIGLTWNISDAYTSSLEKKRADKVWHGSIHRYELQKLQMNTSLNAVTTRIEQQLNQVTRTTQALISAGQAYDLYLSRYEAGLINLTELLQIQSLLQQVEKDAIGVQQEMWNLITTKSEISGDFNFLSTHFN